VNRTVSTLILLAAILAAGCTTSPPAATVPSSPPAVGDISTAAVSNANGGTGGTVRDVAATVPTLTSSVPSVDNSGGGLLALAGTVADANGESDLAFIYLKGTTYSPTNGFQYLGLNHTITPAEQAATSEPASFGSDGYKVWNCGTRDGILCWKDNLAVPAFAQAGVYTFNATTGKNASVAQSLLGVMQTATVISFSQIDIAPYPVDAAGAIQTGSNWGAWTANPGDANVVASNYLKLTNNGDVPNARVQISFSGTNFTGVTDSSWFVGFANNIQFATCDTTASAPSACTFSAWTPANAGSVTVTFQGMGHIAFVQYRIVSLPATLPSQSYGATFTATEL
jgi:hypothetical protein